MKSATAKPEVIPFWELIAVDRLVQDQPGISPDELVEATGIPRGRVRTIIIRLEARGRVRRRQGTEDQFEPVAGGVERQLDTALQDRSAKREDRAGGAA